MPTPIPRSSSRSARRRIRSSSGCGKVCLRLPPATGSPRWFAAGDRAAAGRRSRSALPSLQSPSPAVFVYLRTSEALAAERSLRQLLGSLDRDIALGASRMLADILAVQRAGARLLAGLLAVFAVVAAALALVGIYAVFAYTVQQREREIAMRLAIGANRRMITRMFVRQGGLVRSAGLVLGICGALGLGRVLREQLFGVAPVDPACWRA
jgi:hypothetical protein